MTGSTASDDAIARLAPGYRALFDAVLVQAETDERIRGLWLSGSLARGDADAWSDLDVIVAIAAESFDAFASSWREWIDAITPTVLARALPFGGGAYCVTPAWLRFDLVWERAEDSERSWHRQRCVVFDRGGLSALVPPPLLTSAPTVDDVLAAIDETLRTLGLFEVIAGRSDWLLGMEGAQLVRAQLRQLFAWENQPQPVVGVKRALGMLTEEQRAVLQQLPPLLATRDAVVAGHFAVARAFLPRARSLLERLGGEYPEAFEAATRAHLIRVLGTAW
jgi:predicted nucleotidyltransferase